MDNSGWLSAATIADWMSAFSGFVWSTPTALLLTGAGLLFTLMTFGIQFKALTHGFAVIRGKYDNPEDAGNISHFQALCAALSATIGLGNISGVAIALVAGGPGAVFWMWVVGFLGMATKFTTCSLATMYRRQDSFGEYRGGPMYYIEMGLGGAATTSGMKYLAKGLAVLFAILGMSASVGAGNMYQANEVANITVNLVKKTTSGVTATAEFWIQMGVGLVICVLAALVILGGIKRIGRVASKLIPTMCVAYVGGALYVILANWDAVPGVFGDIFAGAFTGAAGKGAFYGVAVRTAVIQGVRRACFSNEAGLGSAPIAHATAKTNEPIREGVVAAVGPFVDTIVICTMTALVILTTNSLNRDAVGTIAELGPVQTLTTGEDGVIQQGYQVTLAISDEQFLQKGEEFFVHRPPVDPAGVAEQLFLRSEAEPEDGQVVVTMTYAPGTAQLDEAIGADRALLAAESPVYLHRVGVQLTAFAFDRQIRGFGTYFMPFAAFFFAFSTIVSWGFYGETCTEYLFGEWAVKPFKFVFVCMILLGTASLDVKPVIDWSDAMLGLMLVPNLIGTLLLAPVVMRATREYFRRLNSGEFEEEARRAAEAKRRR